MNKVINLGLIPDEIRDRILEKYKENKPTPNMKVLNYLVTNRLNNLMESVGDFHRK